jgi:hypothetical protein
LLLDEFDVEADADVAVEDAFDVDVSDPHPASIPAAITPASKIEMTFLFIEILLP